MLTGLPRQPPGPAPTRRPSPALPLPPAGGAGSHLGLSPASPGARATAPACTPAGQGMRAQVGPHWEGPLQASAAVAAPQDPGSKLQHVPYVNLSIKHSWLHRWHAGRVLVPVPPPRRTPARGSGGAGSCRPPAPAMWQSCRAACLRCAAVAQALWRCTGSVEPEKP